MPSTMVSIIQPIAAFCRRTSNALSAVPRMTTSQTTRHSPMRSVRAWSKSPLGMAAMTDAMDVT